MLLPLLQGYLFRVLIDLRLKAKHLRGEVDSGSDEAECWLAVKLV